MLRFTPHQYKVHSTEFVAINASKLSTPYSVLRTLVTGRSV